jgi:hypothetical protein
MAYTFEELATWWPGKQLPIGVAKLVITQEDGRTCYAYGEVKSFPAANRFEGQFQQQFNDRTKRVNSVPANPGGPYDQNFDILAIDPVDFAFIKTAATRFELRLTLLNWGNAIVTVNMTKARPAKLYTGWGTTIGAGTGQALFVVSLNGANETPG